MYVFTWRVTPEYPLPRTSVRQIASPAARKLSSRSQQLRNDDPWDRNQIESPLTRSSASWLRSHGAHWTYTQCAGKLPHDELCRTNAEQLLNVSSYKDIGQITLCMWPASGRAAASVVELTSGRAHHQTHHQSAPFESCPSGSVSSLPSLVLTRVPFEELSSSSDTLHPSCCRICSSHRRVKISAWHLEHPRFRTLPPVGDYTKWTSPNCRVPLSFKRNKYRRTFAHLPHILRSV